MWPTRIFRLCTVYPRHGLWNVKCSMSLLYVNATYDYKVELNLVPGVSFLKCTLILKRIHINFNFVSFVYVI